MQNKHKHLTKIRTISFKWKVIILLEFFAIAVNVIIAVVVWNALYTTIHKVSQEKLITVASSAAATIDVAKHESVRSQEDVSGENYLDIQTLLQKIQASDSQIDDIYTMRRTDKEDSWEFVVDAMQTEDNNGDGIIEDSEKSVEIGERYDVSEYPQMKKAFDGPIADDEISCDKWGCWLSGYAPIVDSQGNAVAIVGVDMSAEKIVAFEKKVETILIAIIAILILLIPIVFYVMLTFLMRPMKKIVDGIGSFQNDMAARLDVRSGDEFEMIAVTFNTMAQQLQQLYQNMEQAVKEKTSELALQVEEIEKRNANDEALLASIGDGLVAVNASGEVIMINRHALEILGVTDINTVLHKKFCESMAVEDDKGGIVPLAKRPINLALAKGIRKSFTYSYTRPDGKHIPLYMTVAPIVMSGKTIGAIAVFHDITREKEIDLAKSEFVSLASHQLRTPLSSIKWYAEMLALEQVGKVNEKQLKYLNEIYQSNQRMIELVNSLLNVSRIEMGTFSIEPEMVELHGLIDGVVAEMKPMVTEKKLVVKLEYGKDIPKISADATLVRIILQNLISNAVKYTPAAGSVTIKTELLWAAKKAKKEAGSIKISVVDTGMGIPKSQQKHVFSKLFRADNARESITDGNGLGLYIIKSILDNSGGKISFASEENKGTTFTVMLPLSGMRSRKGTKHLNTCAKIKTDQIDAGNISKK